MARTYRKKAMKSRSSTPAIYMTSQRRIMTIEEPSKTTHGLLDWLLHGLIDACSIRFDSSVNRGDFKTKIGVGKVIRGVESSTYSLDHSYRQLMSRRLGRGCHADELGREEYSDHLWVGSSILTFTSSVAKTDADPPFRDYAYGERYVKTRSKTPLSGCGYPHWSLTAQSKHIQSIPSFSAAAN